MKNLSILEIIIVSIIRSKTVKVAVYLIVSVGLTAILNWISNYIGTHELSTWGFWGSSAVINLVLVLINELRTVTADRPLPGTVPATPDDEVL
jgi:hypothetical protein